MRSSSPPCPRFQALLRLLRDSHANETSAEVAPRSIRHDYCLFGPLPNMVSSRATCNRLLQLAYPCCAAVLYYSTATGTATALLCSPQCPELLWLMQTLNRPRGWMMTRGDRPVMRRPSTAIKISMTSNKTIGKSVSKLLSWTGFRFSVLEIASKQ